ncbi:hypothetical protein D3C71_1239860 [compost metagenome]
MRLLQDLAELRQEGIGETEPVEVEHHRIAIQQAHHHAFTVRGRHGAHAQVQLLALHAQHDAPVLRQAAFGDVQPRHDLDAADHRGGQVGGRALAFDQHPVHAVAHLQAVLEGFDVDVRGTQLEGTLDDQVDQADHRRFGGQVAQMLDVIDGRALAVGGLHDGAHRTAALPVPAFDQVIDLRTQADVQPHRHAHRQAHGIGGVGVLRVAEPQIQHALVQGQRAEMELLEESQ